MVDTMVDDETLAMQRKHREALDLACDALQMSLAEYGRKLGVKDRQTVHQWGVRGRIPAEHIAQVAQDAGLNAADLLKIKRKAYTRKAD